MKNVIVFVLFLSFFSGCAIAPFAVGPIVNGVVMWKEGEAVKYYHEDKNVVYRGVKNSLQELDYKITKNEQKSDSSFNLIAGESDKLNISIRQVKPNITQVKVRINFMGDKDYAELLFKQLDSNINTIEFDDQGKPTKRILRKAK